MLIWTEAYMPFIMGGDVNGPICTEVEVGQRYDVGGGYYAYEIESPSGATYVAESETGAFIGTSILDVVLDISAADPEVMAKQIEDARERAKAAQPLSNEKFWSMFR
jgi:hypothetical protein